MREGMQRRHLLLTGLATGLAGTALLVGCKRSETCPPAKLSPEDIKQRLEGKTITHDFAKFWDKMRAQPGSTRKPLTEEQRRKKPPVSHPEFLVHPNTGRKVLYANPGYAMRVNELPEDESDELLAFLFKHQLQDKFCYVHEWTEGDVLMWDNLGTLHQAWPDYTADEHRLIKRCQVMADRVFDPAFLKSAMMATAAE